MDKTNGYSFAENEATKAQSISKASLAKDNEAPIINKIVGSFVIIVLVNSLIWAPVFIVDSLLAQVITGAISSIVSVIATYFIVKYLKKHWHELVVSEYRSQYNSSTSFRRSSTPSDYFTLPYGRFNRRR